MLAAWGRFIRLDRDAEELEPEATAEAKLEDAQLRYRLTSLPGHGENQETRCSVEQPTAGNWQLAIGTVIRRLRTMRLSDLALIPR
jgi:hypothetical protein